MSEPMTPWYVSLVIAWAPFLLLIWAAWWCGHQVRQLRRSLTSSDGRAIADVLADVAEQLKRQSQK
jgi:hypothetical protein